jgi:hypothetical protein
MKDADERREIDKEGSKVTAAGCNSLCCQSATSMHLLKWFQFFSCEVELATCHNSMNNIASHTPNPFSNVGLETSTAELM